MLSSHPTETQPTRLRCLVRSIVAYSCLVALGAYLYWFAPFMTPKRHFAPGLGYPYKNIQPPMAEPINPSQDPRRRDLIQKAVNAWGTAVIFERRAQRYQRWLKGPSLSGVAIPILFGAVVLAVGVDWEGLKDLAWYTGVFAAIQIVVSAYSLFQGYDDRFRQALDSASANKALAVALAELARNVSIQEEEFARKYSKLCGYYECQDVHDERKSVTERERRMGGRAGLKRFDIPCAKCKLVPSSYSARADKSECKFCGDF